MSMPYRPGRQGPAVSPTALQQRCVPVCDVRGTQALEQRENEPSMLVSLGWTYNQLSEAAWWLLAENGSMVHVAFQQAPGPQSRQGRR